MFFSLNQLILANELLFVSDYERLLRRYSKLSSEEIHIRVMDWQYIHETSLFQLLDTIPRSDTEELQLYLTLSQTFWKSGFNPRRVGIDNFNLSDILPSCHASQS